MSKEALLEDKTEPLHNKRTVSVFLNDILLVAAVRCLRSYVTSLLCSVASRQGGVAHRSHINKRIPRYVGWRNFYSVPHFS